MRWASVITLAATGAGTTALIASFYGMSAAESWDIASVAAIGAMVAGALGSLVLWVLRRWSLGSQLVVASLTSVAAISLGAIVAARSMFLSEHDLHTLFVIVAASATIGVVFAATVGSRIAEASRKIRTATQTIEDGPIKVQLGSSAPKDFREIADELEEMSLHLHEARDKELALDASRRELVAWVSHDLRTPLSGIRAMAEALEDGVVSDDETIARYHRTMREEVDRLALLVDDLFELSRINAGALNLTFEDVHLDDLVSGALAAAAGMARSRGVKVEGHTTTPDTSVRLSPPEMTRVLRNLLENAIRHTPSDGCVWVEAGTQEEVAYVRVADSCGGIPEADIERVFDLAFRGQSQRPRDGGGGLGLAIARGIVEAHEGEISVENQDSGCLFTVRLPLSAPAER
jgi:signal transduction histidine kinase